MLSNVAAISRSPVPSPGMPATDTLAIGIPAIGTYDDLPDRLTGPMSRGQATVLKSLAIEAYQPKQFERDLTREEAARRIEALKQEIALANSF